MSPDEAADVLAELEEETSEEILEEMESTEDEVQRTARVRGGHSRGHDEHRIRRLHENATVADALAALKAMRNCSNPEHAVPDRCDERLVGAVPLATLFRARAGRCCGSWPLETLIQVPWMRSRTASLNCSTSTTCLPFR